MASVTTSFFLLMFCLFGWTHHPAWCVSIDISPDVFNGLKSDTVNVSCRIDQSSANTATEIVVMEILNHHSQNPIVILRHDSVISYGAGLDSRFQAEGQISKAVEDSFLRLTIKDPRKEDSGTYSCLVYFLDQISVLRDSRDSANLTVEDPDTTSVIAFLVDKVSLLDRQIAQQEQTMASLIDENKAQNVTMMHQRNQIASLMDDINQLNDTLRQDHFNDTYQSCAFSMRYSSNHKFQTGQRMIFSTKITNIGNAYDVTTGVFTAPRPGLYVFHLVVTTYNADGGDTITIDIRRNNHVEAQLQAKDKNDEEQSSTTVIFEMKAGDRVDPWVRGFSGKDHAWDSYSVFSGFLLHTL